jgi:hypothetical protein
MAKKATRKPPKRKVGRPTEGLVTADPAAELSKRHSDRNDQFKAAHRKGMAALKTGDYRALGDAINRERELIDEQTSIIKKSTESVPNKKSGK